MGLFKGGLGGAILGAATGGIIGGAGGALGGAALGGVFGSGGRTPAGIDLSKYRGAVDRIKDKSTGDVAQTQAGLKTQELIAGDRAQALDSYREGLGGDTAKAITQTGIFGGQGAGTGERVARSAVKEGALGEQRLRSDFGRLGAEANIQDLASEQAIKNQALFALPGLEIRPAEIQAGVNASQQAADTARRGQNLGLFTGIASAGIGAASGGFGKK